MRASELRIGNYIKSPYGAIRCKINDIQRFENSIYEYRPIPLTEDIILKCGFSRHSDVIFNCGDCMLYLDVNFADFYYKGTPMKTIHSLHELQNGYYWHSNTELIISL